MAFLSSGLTFHVFVCVRVRSSGSVFGSLRAEDRLLHQRAPALPPSAGGLPGLFPAVPEARAACVQPGDAVHVRERELGSHWCELHPRERDRQGAVLVQVAGK